MDYSRTKGIDRDTIEIEFVLIISSKDEIKKPKDESLYLHGIWLEGAR